MIFFSNMCVKIKVENFNDEFYQKLLLINAVMHVESVYYDSKYNYYRQIFLGKYTCNVVTDY